MLINYENDVKKVTVISYRTSPGVWPPIGHGGFTDPPLAHPRDVHILLYQREYATNLILYIYI